MWTKLSVLVVFAVLLAGCGNTGDLYLPEQVTETDEPVEQTKKTDDE